MIGNTSSVKRKWNMETRSFLTMSMPNAMATVPRKSSSTVPILWRNLWKTWLTIIIMLNPNKSMKCYCIMKEKNHLKNGPRTYLAIIIQKRKSPTIEPNTSSTIHEVLINPSVTLVTLDGPFPWRRWCTTPLFALADGETMWPERAGRMATISPKYTSCITRIPSKLLL